MIKKEIRKEILKQWLDNKSMREISRSLGVHRNTVKKKIDEFGKIIDKMGIKDRGEIETHIDEIVGDELFDTVGRWPSKVNQGVKDDVLVLMKDLQWKKGSKAKNAKNITTIYLEINKNLKTVSEAFGYTTICKIVNEHEEKYVFGDPSEYRLQ